MATKANFLVFFSSTVDKPVRISSIKIKFLTDQCNRFRLALALFGRGRRQRPELEVQEVVHEEPAQAGVERAGYFPKC